MCHFVEENIGFNLEIAFIEYFLCKTVFYNKTNTLYNTCEIAPIGAISRFCLLPFSYFSFSSVSKIKYNLWNLM